MPSIKDRSVSNLSVYRAADVSATAGMAVEFSTSFHVSGAQNRLMSPSGGNRVPMRGVLPVEQMSDCDLHNFFPNSAFMDRIPTYTYFALNNKI